MLSYFTKIALLLLMFFNVPHLATYVFLFSKLNEPRLGTGINPGMALAPFLSSI